MSEIQLDKVNLDDYKQIGEGGNYVRKLMKQYY